MQFFKKMEPHMCTAYIKLPHPYGLLVYTYLVFLIHIYEITGNLSSFESDILSLINFMYLDFYDLLKKNIQNIFSPHNL